MNPRNFFAAARPRSGQLIFVSLDFLDVVVGLDSPTFDVF
jgi:hypothetical protein